MTTKKTDSFYLPYKLSPQGWLIDVFLGQLRGGDLKSLYHGKKGKGFFANNKLLILNPGHKNKLKEVKQKTINKATNNPVKDNTTRKDYVDFMLKLTPAQQAVLQPYIRIYLKYETEDKKKKQRDIIFKTFTDINDILRFDYSRMGAAGIEKVSVNREMPSFGLEYHFKVDIDFYFSSMSTLVKGHPSDFINDSQREDYLKLFAPLGKYEDKDGKVENKAKEVLCLEYGWNFSDSTPLDILPHSMREIIRTQEKKKFELVWTSHNFNFNQKGEVSLNVSYVGTPEYAFKRSLDTDNKKQTATMFHKIESVAPLLKDDELKNYKTLVESYDATMKEIKAIQKNIKKEKEHKKNTNKCGKKDPKDKLQGLGIKLNDIMKELSGMSMNIFTKKLIADGQMFQSSFYSTRKGKTHNLFTGIVKVPPETKENNRLFNVVDRKMKIADEKYEYAIRHLEKTAKDVLTNFSNSGDVSILSKKLLKESQKKALKDGKKEEKDIILENINNKLAALTYSHHATPTKKKGAGHLKSTYGNFYFFPLRALISTLYEQTKEEREITIGLGNIVHRFHGEPAWINLGDIPIELNVFKKWFYHNINVKGNIKWKFGDFVDDLMGELVPRILRDYSTESGTNFGSIVRNAYSLSESPSEKLLKDLFDSDDEEHLKKLTKLMVKPTKKIKKGMVFYGQMITEQVRKTEAVSTLLSKIGDRTLTREKDHEDGMYHINIGEDRGVLLEIGFQQQNDDALQTALLFDKNQDTAVPFLKSTYEATPMMFGNNLFNEGGFFVIPINPLGVSAKEDPGIRGYYRVDRVTDVVTLGSYTTSVHGVNLHNGQPKQNKNKEVTTRKGQEKTTKPKPIPISVYKGIEEHIKNTLKFVNTQKIFNLKYEDKCEKTPEQK